jgi:hypothetical protein
METGPTVPASEVLRSAPKCSGRTNSGAAPSSEGVQESDAAHPGRSTSAVIPRPGHAVACFHTRGCRAEESTVGLLEGRRGSPCLLRGYTTAGQGQCWSGATGHQQQTVVFSVGAKNFVRADGAVWRLLRNDIRARAQGILKHTLRLRKSISSGGSATPLRETGTAGDGDHLATNEGRPARGAPGGPCIPSAAEAYGRVVTRVKVPLPV